MPDEYNEVQFFWAKVNKDGPVVIEDLGPCWVWIGAKHRQGYGQFWIGGKCKLTHRISYELHYEPIPTGVFVCHKCDNTSCVNPTHLFLGNQSDNMQDRIAKGRYTKAGDVCPAGHPRDEKNLYLNKYGHKICRVCRRESAKRYRMRVKNDG